MLNLQGWLFGLPYWPVDRLFGPVVAWNSSCSSRTSSPAARPAGGCARSACSAAPRSLGGLAFALAPYRVMQSTGHLLGLMAFLLPLALLGFERGRDGDARWLALGAGALVAVPAHRPAAPRARRDPVRARVRAAARARAPRRRRRRGRGRGRRRRWRGLVVQHAVIDGSVAAGGRSLARGRRATRPTGAASSRATPARSRSSRCSAGSTPLARDRGLRRAGRAALAAARGPARARRGRPGACSRSGRTCRSTSPSGTTSRRSATRACRSGCCRSPAWRSPRWPRSRSTSCARRCSPRSRSWRSTVDLRAGVSLYRPALADTDNAAYAALRSSGPGPAARAAGLHPRAPVRLRLPRLRQQAPRERPGGYSSTAPKSRGARRPRARPAQLRRLEPAARAGTSTRSASATSRCTGGCTATRRCRTASTARSAT